MSAMPVSVSEEMMVAERLLSRLAPECGELVADNERVIAFRLRKNGWKLSRLVFSRDSLRKLAADCLQPVKLDYLERDIKRLACRRSSYVYPYRLRFS